MTRLVLLSKVTVSMASHLSLLYANIFLLELHETDTAAERTIKEHIIRLRTRLCIISYGYYYTFSILIASFSFHGRLP